MLMLLTNKGFLRSLTVKETKNIDEIASKSLARVSRRVGFAGLLLLPALFAGAVLPGAAQSLTAQNQAATDRTNSAAIADRSPNLISYADLVEKISPAVVTVRSERKSTAAPQSQMNIPEELRELFGGRMPQMQVPRVQRGVGSGVIVESNGTILTNNHVVEGASVVRVEFTDRRSFTARVVGTDPASDLAVLKIDATNLPTLALGNSDNVRVGDAVLAVGNPLGLQQTVTSGIISAKGRSTPGNSNGSFEDFLQTDASINQGNSGGALVNTSGELIGINSQILSPSGGSVGIGFAIPSNMAKSVMTQLVAGGRVRRGQLGIQIQDVTPDLAQSFGLKDVRGVIVTAPVPGGAAEQAGLKQGDVIVSLNGTALGSVNELRNRVSQSAPGSVVTVGFVRDGQQQSAKVTLGELQARTTDEEKEIPAPTAEPSTGKLGLTLQPITPQIAQQLELKNAASGLVVKNVQSGSPADDAGITQGDVILEVNRQPVKSTLELNAAMAKKTGSSVLLLVNRKGQTIFISVQV
jgi:serine protease Do